MPNQPGFSTSPRTVAAPYLALQKNMRSFLPWLPVCLLGIGLMSACATTRRTERFYAKTLKKEIEKSPVFAQSFTGFTLLDPETGRTLCDVNGGHYFTPASNAKILTLAACLGILGDSVPALEYVKIDDAVVFQGTGDPTFLHPQFEAWQAARHLLYRPPYALLYIRRNLDEGRFGPGWAWDDYDGAYQAERSALPIYGNCVALSSQPDGKFHVEPTFFGRYFSPALEKEAETKREEFENRWQVTQGETAQEQLLPFRTNPVPAPWHDSMNVDIPPLFDIVTALLSDTLKRDIPALSYENYQTQLDAYPWRTLYSTPLDTVLRRMMYQSDNFIAEQMLLVCAGVKYHKLCQDSVIKWTKDSLLLSPITNNQFPNNQFPRWVDGSGLSRYNLISPRYLTEVLWKLWREQPHDRLLGLFPTAGAPETTLDWWQPIPPTPWLFAKTGSMGGVVCISGYLRTRRGKTLIFSFMNNNFVGSAKPWRLEMRRILELVAGH